MRTIRTKDVTMKYQVYIRQTVEFTATVDAQSHDEAKALAMVSPNEKRSEEVVVDQVRDK